MNNWILRVFILLGTSFWVLASCNKEPEWDGNTTWTGTVRMLGTEEPIPDMKLKLYEVVPDGGGIWGGGAQYRLLEEQNSAADGSFSFTFANNERASSYDLIPEADHYFINSGNLTSYLNNKSPLVERDIIMHPYAWVRVRVKNVPPMEHGNKISFGGSLNGIGTGVLTSSIDTTIIGYLLGNTRGNYFRYITYENSNDNIGTAVFPELYFPAHDTTDLYIEF